MPPAARATSPPCESYSPVIERPGFESRRRVDCADFLRGGLPFFPATDEILGGGAGGDRAPRMMTMESAADAVKPLATGTAVQAAKTKPRATFLLSRQLSSVLPVP